MLRTCDLSVTYFAKLFEKKVESTFKDNTSAMARWMKAAAFQTI